MIKMLREIGYDAISPDWKNIGSLSELAEIADTADKYGLLVQSLHAPTAKAADMWSDDTRLGSEARNDLLAALSACGKYSIPILVVHTWKGLDYSFDADTLNYGNFDEIVSFAAQHGIKIAFENTEGEEFLFALMEHFKNCETVGFCWDSGHEMCYNHSQDLLSKLGGRLIMTHLQDNLGISSFDGRISSSDDLHLLPYDGIADWDLNIERLKRSAHVDILNFELKTASRRFRHENDLYGQLTLPQFYTEAYKRACKIAYGYAKQI